MAASDSFVFLAALGFAGLAGGTMAGRAAVCRAASVIRGVPLMLSWDISCLAAGSGLGTVDWARIKPGTRNTRQTVVKIRMGTLSRSYLEFLVFLENLGDLADSPGEDTRGHSLTTVEQSMNIA